MGLTGQKMTSRGDTDPPKVLPTFHFTMHQYDPVGKYKCLVLRKAMEEFIDKVGQVRSADRDDEMKAKKKTRKMMTGIHQTKKTKTKTKTERLIK